MTAHKFMKLSIAALCLVAAAVLPWVGFHVNDAADKISESVAFTTSSIPEIVQREVSSAREEITSRIDTGIGVAEHQAIAARFDANKQIRLTRESIEAQMDAMRGTAEVAAGVSIKLADEHAKAIESRMDRATLIFARSAAPFVSIADQIDAAAPDFLDCDQGKNHNCLLERYIGTARGIQQAAEAVGRAAPVLTADAEKIAGHVEHVSKDIERSVDHALEPKTKKRIMLELLIPTAAGFAAGRIF